MQYSQTINLLLAKYFSVQSKLCNEQKLPILSDIITNYWPLDRSGHLKPILPLLYRDYYQLLSFDYCSHGTISKSRSSFSLSSTQSSFSPVIILLVSTPDLVGGLRYLYQQFKSYHPDLLLISTSDFVHQTISATISDCCDYILEHSRPRIFFDMTHSSDFYAPLILRLFSSIPSYRILHDAHMCPVGSSIFRKSTLSFFNADLKYICLEQKLRTSFNLPCHTFLSAPLPVTPSSKYTRKIHDPYSASFVFSIVASSWKLKQFFQSTYFREVIAPFLSSQRFSESELFVFSTHDIDFDLPSLPIALNLFLGKDVSDYFEKIDFLIDTYPYPGGITPYQFLLHKIPVLTYELLNHSFDDITSLQLNQHSCFNYSDEYNITLASQLRGNGENIIDILVQSDLYSAKCMLCSAVSKFLAGNKHYFSTCWHNLESLETLSSVDIKYANNYLPFYNSREEHLYLSSQSIEMLRSQYMS